MQVIPTEIDGWERKEYLPKLLRFANAMTYGRITLWRKDGLVIEEYAISEQKWQHSETPTKRGLIFHPNTYTVKEYINRYGEVIRVLECNTCEANPELRKDIRTGKYYTTCPSSMIPAEIEDGDKQPGLNMKFYAGRMYASPQAALLAWNRAQKRLKDKS